MKNREVDLLKLGFTLEYVSYSLHKYGNTYWVDAWDIEEDTDEEWEQRIKNIKEDLIKSKKIHETGELYLLGFCAKQKQTEKIILDLLNKYRSNLLNEQRIKLTKVINQDKVNLLKTKIEILQELQNKLK